MIIVKLMGGLGNQMFQYALGRHLAIQRCVSLKLDVSWFAGQTLRQFKLDRFNIQAEIASSEEIFFFTREDWPTISRKLYLFAQRLFPMYFGKVIKQKGLYFSAEMFNSPKKIYLNGYWQSEKYFKVIETMLRQDFTLKKGLSSKSARIIGRVKECPSVSLHVRRKDYVEDKNTTRVHGVCSIEYYEKAVKYLRENIPNASFFVFSDDLSWAAKNLSFLSPIEFVDAGGNIRDEEELILMSACKHHIIANSTYSWWGAWLGTYPEKIVVAPRRWFNDMAIDTNDIVLETWIRM